MSEMRISSETALPPSFTRSAPEKAEIQPGKVIAPRMMQSTQDVGKALYKLGDFLQNALLELHVLATGSQNPPATVQTQPAFATAEAAHAAQSASAFLQLHDQQAH